MDNFSFGGGGKKRRDDFIGGRPKSDANYGPKKKSFDKKPGFRGGSDRPKHQGDRELFATHCTTCGKSCEVPFRPDGSKPVLCRDCFAKNNPPERGDFKVPRQDFSRGNDRGDRNFRKPERRDHAPIAVTHDSTHYVALTKQVTALETKLNEIITLLRTANPAPAVVAAPIAEPDMNNEATEESAAPKKAAKKAAKRTAKQPAKKTTKTKKK